MLCTKRVRGSRIYFFRAHTGPKFCVTTWCPCLLILFERFPHKIREKCNFFLLLFKRNWQTCDSSKGKQNLLNLRPPSKFNGVILWIATEIIILCFARSNSDSVYYIGSPMVCDLIWFLSNYKMFSLHCYFTPFHSFKDLGIIYEVSFIQF
jgi:hypothetical protein